MSDKTKMVALSRDTLGLLIDAAHARRDQWRQHSKGVEDPYLDDCIMECDQEEAENMVKLYNKALIEANEVVSESFEAEKKQHEE